MLCWIDHAHFLIADMTGVPNVAKGQISLVFLIYLVTKFFDIYSTLLIFANILI